MSASVPLLKYINKINKYLLVNNHRIYGEAKLKEKFEDNLRFNPSSFNPKSFHRTPIVPDHQIISERVKIIPTVFLSVANSLGNLEVSF